uniref:Uncharacterized protein n=1 Tax=Rhizophora mucronata TaxID=61149 RepID=A0A2P2NIX9_RHIMU
MNIKTKARNLKHWWGYYSNQNLRNNNKQISNTY